MSATYNRGKLLRLAKAGRLVRVASYRFDDMYGAEQTRSDAAEIPVRIIARGSEWKDGFCNLYESDFKSSGRAWDNGNGTICLYIHSNHNVDVRVIDVPNPEAVYIEVADINSKAKKRVCSVCGGINHGREEHFADRE